MIISHILQLFIIAFGNFLCCVFSEYRRDEYSFTIFELSLVFNYLCCVYYFFDFFFAFKF